MMGQCLAHCVAHSECAQCVSVCLLSQSALSSGQAHKVGGLRDGQDTVTGLRPRLHQSVSHLG